MPGAGLLTRMQSAFLTHQKADGILRVITATRSWDPKNRARGVRGLICHRPAPSIRGPPPFFPASQSARAVAWERVCTWYLFSPSASEQRKERWCADDQTCYRSALAYHDIEISERARAMSPPSLSLSLGAYDGTGRVGKGSALRSCLSHPFASHYLIVPYYPRPVEYLLLRAPSPRAKSEESRNGPRKGGDSVGFVSPRHTTAHRLPFSRPTDFPFARRPIFLLMP